MTVDWPRIEQVLARARERGADALVETEGLEILDGLGIPRPPHVFVTSPDELDDPALDAFDGDLVVVKVVSPRILHKSDVGGVRIVPKEAGRVRAVVAEMAARFEGQAVAGFSVSEFVRYDPALGSELLLGLRSTDDFGPVVTIGPGGIYTEFLAANFRPGRDVAVFSPEWADEGTLVAGLERLAVDTLVAGRLRGQAPRLERHKMLPAIRAFTALAGRAVAAGITECEINPLVVADGRLVALDILVKLAAGSPPAPPAPRPTDKLQRLLEPRSAAIIGVSEKLNPGHIILNNLIRDGFDRSRITVVKRGAATFEGCRAVADIPSMPEKVDLFVLAISAAQAPEAIAQIIEGEKAETLIVIPGGLEEKQGSEALVGRMHAALAGARASAWRGPLVNGGNCLGIRSRPGRYDTMFIPGHKLPAPHGAPSPLAIVSQSGAFAITQVSKLEALNPKYVITVGNQMDVTVGDYLEYLAGDPEIEVFAVYVEGFRPLDGRRFLAAARRIVAGGRPVVLYRAGRTQAGAQASRSHTASVAGDYTVTRALATLAGVVVAEDLRDFADLTRLFTALRGKKATGWNLGAISNAGFECVAIADNLGRFALPAFAGATAARLEAVFRAARIDSVVDVHNPLDLTPMAGDAAYEDALRAVLADPGIDAAVLGCVPLTPALETLPPNPAHGEDAGRAGSVASRLVALWTESVKPWVAIVDAGALYDPLVEHLEAGGVPTFREADRALRLLNVVVANRLARGVAEPPVQAAAGSHVPGSGTGTNTNAARGRTDQPGETRNSGAEPGAAQGPNPV